MHRTNPGDFFLPNKRSDQPRVCICFRGSAPQNSQQEEREADEREGGSLLYPRRSYIHERAERTLLGHRDCQSPTSSQNLRSCPVIDSLSRARATSRRCRPFVRPSVRSSSVPGPLLPALRGRAGTRHRHVRYGAARHRPEGPSVHARRDAMIVRARSRRPS